MTIRAVILGLLGAALMCAFTYFNDHVIRQSWLVFSSTPTAVYGMLIILVLAINPLITRLRARFRLTGSELAVALALTIIPCCIPSAGLMETFPNVVMMPHHFAKTDPGWKAEGIVEMAPDVMLPDPSDDDTVVTGYVQGLSTGTQSTGVSDVPWSAWGKTLAFWLPMALLLWGGLIGLALVVHRQWSKHERLPYPIATFTEALLPPDGGKGRPVYLERLFLVGCGAVMFIHLTGYLHAWWPDYTFELPRRFYLYSFRKLMPMMEDPPGTGLVRVSVVFTVVGLAFFLPKDVSFSLGIGPTVFSVLGGILAGYGVAMGGATFYDMSLRRALQAGAYAGLLVIVLYTGRRYYWCTLRAAAGLKSPDPVPPHAVWGARILIGCAVAFAVGLMAVGLSWPLAILYTALIVAAYACIGRLSAETGLIFIQLYWEPAALVVALFGVRAVGPTAALIMFLVSSALILDTRESIVPFVLNSLRVVDARRVSIGRVSALSVGALLLGLAIAVPVTLAIKYDRGTNLSYRWASLAAPRHAFDEAVRIKRRVQTQGMLSQSETAGGCSRLLSISPSPTLVAGFTAALLVFLALSVARLRFPSWPLHPVMLLTWATFPGGVFAGSILIGFVVKYAVAKYGGDKAYRRLKPLMIGLIAGDMAFGIGASVIGGIYYAVTGSPPPRFSVFY